jgi:hypothetical protein
VNNDDLIFNNLEISPKKPKGIIQITHLKLEYLGTVVNLLGHFTIDMLGRFAT